MEYTVQLNYWRIVMQNLDISASSFQTSLICCLYLCKRDGLDCSIRIVFQDFFISRWIFSFMGLYFGNLEAYRHNVGNLHLPTNILQYMNLLMSNLFTVFLVQMTMMYLGILHFQKVQSPDKKDLTLISKYFFWTLFQFL